jgi:SAM-dependent methyltransferase
VSGYYDNTLAAERLKLVYDLASPRIRQYLKAEMAHVISHLNACDLVLELGCGYGRVLARLSPFVATAVGIDTSLASLTYGRRSHIAPDDCLLVCADAVHLPFPDGTFDCVVCIQNGISAFDVNRLALVRESLRVTKHGGKALFSSYTEQFWPHRLEWFEAQSKAGLVGPIDYSKTGNGVIVCADGFIAHTVGFDEFLSVALQMGIGPLIREIDKSSLFCELKAE